MRAPREHEHAVRRSAERSVVVQARRWRRLLCAGAIDHHRQLLAARVQLPRRCRHERAERFAVFDAVVLEVHAHARIERVARDRCKPRQRRVARGRVGQDLMDGRAVLAVDAWHHRDVAGARIAGDRGDVASHDLTTRRRAFEVGGIDHADRVRVRLEVRQRIGGACQQERLQARSRCSSRGRGPDCGGWSRYGRCRRNEQREDRRARARARHMAHRAYPSPPSCGSSQMLWSSVPRRHRPIFRPSEPASAARASSDWRSTYQTS
jgi:hypothetical protein